MALVPGHVLVILGEFPSSVDVFFGEGPAAEERQVVLCHVTVAPLDKKLWKQKEIIINNRQLINVAIALFTVVNLLAAAVNLALSRAYVEVQVSHQDCPVARHRMEARRATAIVSQPNGGISESWGRFRWYIELEYAITKQSHLCQTSFPKGTVTIVLLASKRGWVTVVLGLVMEGFSCRASAEWGRKR